MQEFSQTRNGQIFLGNVARIAKALEQLADALPKLTAAIEARPAPPKETHD